MVSTNEILKLINGLSLGDRLKIAEEILRGIREDKSFEPADIGPGEPKILELAGIFTDENAEEFNTAVKESRQIGQRESLFPLG